MSKSWTAYAKHILDAHAKLEKIKLRGNITEDFVLYDAALRNLQTLSEATQQIPEDIKQQYSNIPWKQISGFRNILAHNYLGTIDPLTILNVLNIDLPLLVEAIKKILNEYPNE